MISLRRNLKDIKLVKDIPGLKLLLLVRQIEMLYQAPNAEHVQSESSSIEMQLT